ncbi:glycosyltransferase [Cognataquiflexum rubidum]|uniref:glycosyltransferase n=1 Tax=Cognataquiflexum rubidum TaxID=2922273 RepID=UPI001F1475DC|nr:glycosyltransferase [Cognataquiflexum rubidum]
MKGVSIIICTFNGCSKLQTTLEYISKLIFDGPWELLVIDNNSTDGTFEFLQEQSKKLCFDHTILSCPIPGKMFAFWEGIHHSKYDFILDCDDDNWLEIDYLKIGFSVMEQNPKIGALGGKGQPVSTIDLPNWFQQYFKVYAVGAQGKSIGDLGISGELYGAGTFFRKKPLLEWNFTGLTNFLTCRKGDTLSSGGDTELCEILKLKEYEIWYSDDLKFKHFIAPEKLTIQYLLRLKKGIATSFPILEAYRRQSKKTTLNFHLSLFRLFAITAKSAALSNIVYLVKRNYKNKIFKTTYNTMIFSFIKNYPYTLRVYKELKSIKQK